MSQSPDAKKMSAGNATPVILALEASGDELSVAVYLAGKLHAQICHAARHGHAALITPMISDVMTQAAINFADVTHVAAGVGPGSFTGIRVALATAKGLCLATGAKGVGVNGLAALAHRLNLDIPVLVSADTRRGPCYAQFFDRNGASLGDVIETEADSIGAHVPSDIGALAIVGWQAESLAAALAAQVDTISIPRDVVSHVQAADIAAYAESLIASGEDDAGMTPLYLAPAFLGPSKKASQ
jgi:tRNA threonylcarbamoyladenosine biosynthesis protein TsaB